MRKSSLLLLVALAVAAALGCDNDSPTAPVVEEPEEVPTFVDTFTGTLVLGQTSCHRFTAANRGAAEITITGLQPLETLTVGVGIGLDDGDPQTACPYFALDNSVRVGETLLSQLIDVTDYCVCIFDVGNIFAGQTVTYVFDVEHP